MSKVEELIERLDELVIPLSADADAGRESDPELVAQYEETLIDFIREDTGAFITWLKEVRAA